MKKPWFRWLSIFAFMVLFGVSSMKILLNWKHKKDLWLSLVGKIMILWIGYIMLPCAIGIVAMVMFEETLPLVSLILNVIVLLYIYFAGIHITNKLFTWYQDKLK